MSREINFRAWDIARQAMLPVVCVAYPWLQVSPPDDDEEGNKSYELNHALYEDESGEIECHLMQFTGLKDKNGVEIYEGDVVCYSNRKNHHTEFSEIYVIEYGEQDLGSHTFQQTIGWNATHAHQFGKPTGMDTGRLSQGILSLFGCHEVKVIGNIYENPELLGGDEL